jgi:hypothetical protein
MWIPKLELAIFLLYRVNTMGVIRKCGGVIIDIDAD